MKITLSVVQARRSGYLSATSICALSAASPVGHHRRHHFLARGALRPAGHRSADEPGRSIAPLLPNVIVLLAFLLVLPQKFIELADSRQLPSMLCVMRYGPAAT
jgi:hypothetical protein